MLLGKHYLFLFPSKTHKKFPSQLDKIGWFPSQLIKFISQPGIKLLNIYKNERNNNNNNNINNNNNNNNNNNDDDDDDDDDNNNNTYIDNDNGTIM